MKILHVLMAFLLLASCAPRETVYVPPPTPTPPTPPPPKEYRTFLKCEESTDASFNRCGIEVLPFARTAFHDLDGDGFLEMIIGSKDGSLGLYKPFRDGDSQRWEYVDGYFGDIKVGAFSAPAVGDIDNDGRPEILIGTGGFSRESGKVIFYGNAGDAEPPKWQRIEAAEFNVGNDATPALADVDQDGRLDMVVGNSAGGLVLFRNESGPDGIAFRRDGAYFGGMRLGTYVAPTVLTEGDRVVVIAGDSMGKITLLERTRGSRNWSRTALDISTTSFAAPTFLGKSTGGGNDLVVSDGNGRLFHFRNVTGDFRTWEEIPDMFQGRMHAGPASKPSMVELDGRSYLLVGNIFGRIKFFEYDEASSDLPWIEKPHYFGRVRLSGFSKAVITVFQEKELLIVGEQEGVLRAYLNFGSLDNPLWTEQTRFFEKLPVIPHASPAVFDVNGDGRWELIVGDASGTVHAFRYSITEEGTMDWIGIEKSFSAVTVDKYASPTLFRDADTIYLLVGQQDGRIETFAAPAVRGRYPVFVRSDALSEIRVRNHSTPSAHHGRNGMLELFIGDYDGNLKHFACRKEKVEVSSH